MSYFHKCLLEGFEREVAVSIPTSHHLAVLGDRRTDEIEPTQPRGKALPTCTTLRTRASGCFYVLASLSRQPFLPVHQPACTLLMPGFWLLLIHHPTIPLSPDWLATGFGWSFFRVSICLHLYLCYSRSVGATAGLPKLPAKPAKPARKLLDVPSCPPDRRAALVLF